MTVDTGLVAIMRDDLAAHTNIREVRMFGGLCFMKDGHMLCGIHKTGAMYRVGRDRSQDALSLPGARVMDMTGRAMPSIVNVTEQSFADDTLRAQWLQLALRNVASLPPKNQ